MSLRLQTKELCSRVISIVHVLETKSQILFSVSEDAPTSACTLVQPITLFLGYLVTEEPLTWKERIHVAGEDLVQVVMVDPRCGLEYE